MAKKLSKEFMDLIKDPEVLEQVGLKKADDDIEELFKPIEITDDMTTADVVRIYNERGAKQAKLFKKLQGAPAKEAERLMKERDQQAQESMIDKFLEENPWVESNKDFLKKLKPLYDMTGDLTSAFKDTCKLMDLDPATGKAPEAEPDKDKDKNKDKDKKADKVSAFKNDTNTLGADDDKGGKGEGDGKDLPKKSLREIVSEHANKLAAEGKNPFRDAEAS